MYASHGKNLRKYTKKFHATSKTAAEYLKDLAEAYIIEKVDQVEIKGRKQIGASYKYYFADSGLRNACLDFLHRDDGHLMENVIFNELRYRGLSVETGRVTVWSKNKNKETVRKNYEADFSASLGSRHYYIQSVWSLSSRKIVDRETASLRNIRDSFKKIVVTQDPIPLRRDKDGILYINVIDFLLDENSLEL